MNHYFFLLTINDDFEQHFAFYLIEEFGTLVDVVILSRIRTADNHHDEIIFFEYLLVTDWWLQAIPVPVDPCL